jgi:hypothetical protein
MANVDAAFGMIPVKYRDGRPYTGAYTRCYVPATDGTALYIGDPVQIAGSADADGVPTVTRATAAGGNYVFGSIVAVEPETADSYTYRVASTARYVHVASDPDLLFMIQEDSDGGALAATNVGQNVDLVAGTGSTVTGKSGFEADSSTANTTNTLQLRIHGIMQTPDNSIGTNARLLVSINLHQNRYLTGI